MSQHTEGIRSENFDLRHYVFFETNVAIIINIGFSLIANILTFHGQERIGVFGRHGLIINAIPQTFMVVLMTVTGVLLVTRARLRRGKCGQIRNGDPVFLILGTALLMAIISTFICVWLVALILPKVDSSGMNFLAMLVFESAYGAVLAAIITPLTLFLLFRRH